MSKKRKRVVVYVLPGSNHQEMLLADNLQTAINSGSMHQLVRVRACNVTISREEMVRAQMALVDLLFYDPASGEVIGSSPITAWLLMRRTNWRTYLRRMSLISSRHILDVEAEWTRICIEAVRARHRDLIAVHDCLVA